MSSFYNADVVTYDATFRWKEWWELRGLFHWSEYTWAAKEDELFARNLAVQVAIREMASEALA